MDPHYITEESYNETTSALRDILYLYDDAVRSYNRIGHNLDVGSFNPFKFVSALLDEPLGYCFGIDLELIHQGSAVAILCHLSDFWDEFDGEGIGNIGITKTIKEGLNQGLYDCVPLAKSAISAAFDDQKTFRKLLDSVYNEYIMGYYKRRVTPS